MPSLRSRPSSFSVPPAAAAGRWAGFTLIELMVTLVILSILASLTLMGLAGVRRNAKIAKTKNTIRKIDAVIRPMYDSYRTRRVAPSPTVPTRTAAALDRLVRLRTLMVREMPDSWNDVPDLQEFRNLPSWQQTSPLRSYVSAKPVAPNPFPAYGSAECLYMIVSRSGFEPDALESFRSDEIGDIDGNGAPEFLDGWGRPIAFLRWAPGYVSPTQANDPVDSHDPYDPMRVDASAFAMTPLIYSPGPDEALNDPSGKSEPVGYGLSVFEDGLGWSTQNLAEICRAMNKSGEVIGGITQGNPTAHRDNITNNDLLRK
jgi:prepilin-type N-terminal cleavage/methylation domain-containing protein